jgi:WXG100 family type VII secretion target
MAERIQIKYEEINQLAAQLHQQAEQVGSILQKVRFQVESLSQSWLGEAAVAFRQEMEEEVLPSLKRLSDSLEMGADGIQQSGSIYREAEEEAVRQLSNGAAVESGTGASVQQAASTGIPSRPALSGDVKSPKAPVGRVSEPLRMSQGMMLQNSIVDMRHTNPSVADRVYKQIVAMEPTQGFQFDFKIGNVEVNVDFGSGVHVTMDGMDGGFSDRTLDVIWENLGNHHHASVTVPSLSNVALDQLESLTGLAKQEIDPSVFIAVRETLPR